MYIESHAGVQTFGNSPFILKVISGDLIYHGGFTLTVSIGIAIEVMGHSISVPVMVTARITRLHGRAVVYIPPPPSSRLWFAFEREPTCDIDIDTAIGTAGTLHVHHITTYG